MKQLIIIIVLGAFIFACGNKTTETKSDDKTASAAPGKTEEEDLAKLMESEGSSTEVQTEFDGINAQKIFKMSCSVCHGNDGKLGANGSKDLTMSVMTLEERVGNITNGKGLMTAFGAILSPEEIQAVAKYTFELKKLQK